MSTIKPALDWAKPPNREFWASSESDSPDDAPRAKRGPIGAPPQWSVHNPTNYVRILRFTDEQTLACMLMIATCASRYVAQASAAQIKGLGLAPPSGNDQPWPWLVALAKARHAQTKVDAVLRRLQTNFALCEDRVTGFRSAMGVHALARGGTRRPSTEMLRSMLQSVQDFVRVNACESNVARREKLKQIGRARASAQRRAAIRFLLWELNALRMGGGACDAAMAERIHLLLGIEIDPAHYKGLSCDELVKRMSPSDWKRYSDVLPTVDLDEWGRFVTPDRLSRAMRRRTKARGLLFKLGQRPDEICDEETAKRIRRELSMSGRFWQLGKPGSKTSFVGGTFGQVANAVRTGIIDQSPVHCASVLLGHLRCAGIEMAFAGSRADARMFDEIRRAFSATFVEAYWDKAEPGADDAAQLKADLGGLDGEAARAQTALLLSTSPFVAEGDALEVAQRRRLLQEIEHRRQRGAKWGKDTHFLLVARIKHVLQEADSKGDAPRIARQERLLKAVERWRQHAEGEIPVADLTAPMREMQGTSAGSLDVARQVLVQLTGGEDQYVRAKTALHLGLLSTEPQPFVVDGGAENKIHRQCPVGRCMRILRVVERRCQRGDEWGEEHHSMLVASIKHTLQDADNKGDAPAVARQERLLGEVESIKPLQEADEEGDHDAKTGELYLLLTLHLGRQLRQAVAEFKLHSLLVKLLRKHLAQAQLEFQRQLQGTLVPLRERLQEMKLRIDRSLVLAMRRDCAALCGEKGGMTLQERVEAGASSENAVYHYCAADPARGPTKYRQLLDNPGDLRTLLRDTIPGIVRMNQEAWAFPGASPVPASVGYDGGQLKVVSSNGASYTGLFDGMYVPRGRGSYVHPTGWVVTGPFWNGLPHGVCTLRHPKYKFVVTGEWRHGAPATPKPVRRELEARPVPDFGFLYEFENGEWLVGPLHLLGDDPLPESRGLTACVAGSLTLPEAEDVGVLHGTYRWLTMRERVVNVEVPGGVVSGDRVCFRFLDGMGWQTRTTVVPPEASLGVWNNAVRTGTFFPETVRLARHHVRTYDRGTEVEVGRGDGERPVTATPHHPFDTALRYTADRINNLWPVAAWRKELEGWQLEWMLAAARRSWSEIISLKICCQLRGLRSTKITTQRKMVKLPNNILMLIARWTEPRQERVPPWKPWSPRQCAWNLRV